MYLEEIIDMSIKNKNTQYDILTSDVKYDASNFTMLRDFYTAHNDGKTLTEKALRSMGFYNEEGLLTNGALLFADDYQDKKTEVQCSLFSGFNKESEKIVTINKFNGNIISVINYIMEFVIQRMNLIVHIYSSSDHFTLVLPDLTYMNGIEDSNIPILTFIPVADGTDYDDKVLSFCYYQAHKVSEIAAYLGISDSTYLRKQVLV